MTENPPPRRHRNKWLPLIALAVAVILAALLVIVSPLSTLVIQHVLRQPAATAAASPSGGNISLAPHPTVSVTTGTTPFGSPVSLNGYPHVQGNRIVDGSGQPVLLRGGQIEGVFNFTYVSRPTVAAFPTLMKVMHDVWRMNILRLPTCAYVWQQNQAGYISRLQIAVQQANAAGLYVIIDAYNAGGCNPTFLQDTYHLPTPNLDAFWTTVAGTFRSNPMVIFDVYNEPAIQGTWRERYTTQEWQLWLNGGTVNGVSYLGMQHLVNTIRATGARQIIMVEGYAFGATYYNIGQNLLSDPLNNIVYEAHWYTFATPPSEWDRDFGFMAASHAVFVGEWGLLASDNNGNMNCSNIPQSQVNQVVSQFLNYMAAHNMGWTAYSFTIKHMLLNYSGFTPTTFSVPSSTYCQESGQGGMGEDVKTYLTGVP